MRLVALFLTGGTVALLAWFLLPSLQGSSAESGEITLRTAVGHSFTAIESFAHSLSNAAILFLGALVVLAGLLFRGLLYLSTCTRTCPQCGRWWAAVYQGRRDLRQKHGYALVTRTARAGASGMTIPLSGDNPMSSHSLSGTITWQERVPVIRTGYENVYCCKYCAAKWSTPHIVQEVENFDHGGTGSHPPGVPQ
jgi:hypothetical protein